MVSVPCDDTLEGNTLPCLRANPHGKTLCALDCINNFDILIVRLLLAWGERAPEIYSVAESVHMRVQCPLGL
jgi:hypothetical protein